jgi:hypothetical protein
VASDRYAGKPLLLLLELYVLWAIDELSEFHADRLEDMTQRLTVAFGGDGSWQDALAQAMDLPPEMAELIRERWARNRAIADERDEELTPQAFAEMFIDANFAV